MNDTIGARATDVRPIPSGGSAADHLLDSAVRYAEDRRWDVFPGTSLLAGEGDGGPLCSCGDPNCPAPGAHPAGADWSGRTTGSAVTVRRMWAAQPLACVLLSTGRAFDALDVPEDAGCLALGRMERLGLAVGPVLYTPDRRLVFLVLPGAAARIPGLLRRLGSAPSSPDLVVRAAGDWIAAPPTRVGVLGTVRWVRDPGHRLPDVESLIGPLAYACGREAAAREV